MREPEHGKYSTYNNHNCHCDLCKEATRVYMSKYRKTTTGHAATRKANKIADKATRKAAKYVKENLPDVWASCVEFAKREISNV